MIQYKIIALPISKLTNSVRTSFNNLPVDKFLSNSESYKYRYRRYSSASVVDSTLIWSNSTEAFLQDKKINQYAGGVIRAFPPLEQLLKRFIGDNIILFIIGNTIIPAGNYEIGAHQIRITANDKYMGKPAPEGIHQDGFDYVAVSCIDIDNVTGGTSLLVDSKDYNKKLLEKELKSRDILVFNDRIYAHYTSPIVPKIPGNCYRDVIVTTYKLKP
jgi:hypothetical protein